MSKHTPGPWRAYEDYPDTIEFSTESHADYGGMRVTVDGINYRTGLEVGPAEHMANMRLIAAAPDLLAMLTEAHEIIDAIGQPDTAEVAARMRDVIAKAKGDE